MHLILQAGVRIGRYEILTAIGKGGMGEVWQARDTTLRRDVAIKALPNAVAQDPARLVRLEHEAALLAAINHPNIATIYGLEQFEGTSFLVLELVDGNTLEDRLLHGAIPVETALTLALQLAHALEAAHGKDIIHRDLKPSNIKVTQDKRLKVLDFGIAKALAPSDDNETRTLNLTETGAIVGTPAYMSPEQARGDAVGVQSDIWSFGAVLYEMLTGVSPFKRKTSADTIASVLESQPEYPALPAAAPFVARRLVQRCLEKDPSRRLRHMQDVRILVEEALASLGSTPSDAAVPSAGRRRWWIGGGIAAAALAGSVVGFLAHRPATEKPPVFVSIPFSGKPLTFPFVTRRLAISRDGSTVAFASTNGLQIRRLDQKNSAIVATRASSPFFSPDGEWIGMFNDTTLMKVPASGGVPVTLATITDRPLGGAWRADGTIVFATSDGLFEVSENGGERKVIVKPDRSRQETLYAWPQFLPGGRSLLFTVVSEDANESMQTVLFDLTSHQRRVVLRGSSAVYVPSGHLIYPAGSTLNAVAFDAATGDVTGKPISLQAIDVVATSNGAADFAISDTGTLVFAQPATSALATLEWIDRHGTREPLAVEPQVYGYAMVSPDGKHVAVERTTNGNRDIWILDLKRLTSTQLTHGSTEDMLPVWSADGRRVYFASNQSGTFDVYSQAADGASSAKLEFSGPEFQAPNGVTPDGTRLIVYDRYKDLALLELANPDHLQPLLHSEFEERLGEVSPDGKWIAYESDESGKQFEIILRPFPNVNDRRETLSVNGGRFPRWGPKGTNELYYVDPTGAMMAVPITLSPALVLGKPVKLFDWQKPPNGRSGRLYDVAPDGRFLMSRALAPDSVSQTNVSLILNWLTMLQNRRP